MGHRRAGLSLRRASVPTPAHTHKHQRYGTAPGSTADAEYEYEAAVQPILDVYATVSRPDAETETATIQVGGGPTVTVNLGKGWWLAHEVVRFTTYTHTEDPRGVRRACVRACVRVLELHKQEKHL